jgi:hypothetical protein
VFDSLNLLLTPDGYYYGDTTITQEIHVQQVNQDITGRTFDARIFKDIPASYFFKDQSLYNTSNFSTAPDDLGFLKYNPSPNKKDSVSIRLPDELGKKWFQQAIDNDQQITSSYNFVTEFKGIKLSASQGAAIGFAAAKLKIRLYYHTTTSTEYLQNRSFDIPIYQTTLQYNEIVTDVSATSLSSLERGKSVSGNLTDNETYIQGGSGLVTKVEFPYLNLLMEGNEHITILQSLLIANVVQEYPQVFPLPAQLVLYHTNDLNIPTSAVVSQTNSSAANSAVLNKDVEFNKYVNYTFSINTYITTLIKGLNIYSDQIFIGLNSTDFSSTVNRLRIGSQNNPNYKIKLQVYFSRYQNSN